MTLVVDTSALVAVLFGEPERERFRAVLNAHDAVISAGNMIELLRVVMCREPQWLSDVRPLLDAFGIEIAAVDDPQVILAEHGQLRFGKGRGAPPAVLNFGDLFAYALARHLDAPLLFKGDDFSQTDVRPALTD